VTIALEVRAAHAGDVMALHLLLSSAFAEYEGKLDPPSGAHDETPDSIARKLAEGGAFICDECDAPTGCVFYAPKNDPL